MRCRGLPLLYLWATEYLIHDCIIQIELTWLHGSMLQRCQPLRICHNLYRNSHQLQHYKQKTKKLQIFFIKYIICIFAVFYLECLIMHGVHFQFLLQQSCICMFVNVPAQVRSNWNLSWLVIGCPLFYLFNLCLLVDNQNRL